MKKLFFVLISCVGTFIFNQLNAHDFQPDITVDVNGTGDCTTVLAAFNAVPAGTPTIINAKKRFV